MRALCALEAEVNGTVTIGLDGPHYYPIEIDDIDALHVATATVIEATGSGDEKKKKKKAKAVRFERPPEVQRVAQENEWQIQRPRDKVNTARGLCAGYDNDIYALMRDDIGRTEAYRNAIRAEAPGKVCLDLGTGALALLAIMAAEAGAKRVYAIEVNHEAYVAACAAVDASVYNEVITVFYGYSTEVELPERVDVIIHEIIGEIATLEGVVVALRDALPRFGTITSLCRSIPDRVTSYLTPAMMPDGAYWKGRTPCIVDPRSTSFKVWEFPDRLLLSEPQAFEVIPLYRKPNPNLPEPEPSPSRLYHSTGAWNRFPSW